MPRELIPLFKSGDILTGEMLLALKDHAMNFGNNLFAGYSDGIVKGCRLSFTDSAIILNRGLVRFSGNMYQISEPLSIKYEATNRLSACKLRFEPDEETDSCVIRSYHLLITDLEDEQENDLELCRFKLQQGFRLRSEYVSFEDRITGYDTVNIIHCPFAAYGRSTLCPDIVMEFASEAMHYHLTEPQDLIFCTTVLAAHGEVTRDLLETYLLTRNKQPDQEFSNEQLFADLVELLNKIKEAGDRIVVTVPKKRHMIIVD